ncbi:MAG: ATP-binding cassette domain-containing protein, partial [Deltaproteobacteria bacterium]|nr:ATP-binding cassette domain-containing protein [Deltaproteobacteria bacterium]
MGLKPKNTIVMLLSPECYVPLGLLLFLLLLPLLYGNPFYQNLIIMIFFHGTVASAWNLVGGFAGQVALGHTAFFGIGAYTSTLLYLKFGISPWLGLLAGAAIAMLIATGIGIPCFRLKSHFFALATIAFAEVMRFIASFWRDLTQGGVGLLIPFKPKLGNLIFQSKLPYAYVALGFMLTIILASYVIRTSRFGFYLNGLREDQDAAESLGVNTSRYKLYALLISVFFTAAAGTFYAQYFLFIDPFIAFNLNFSIELALFSIIGGLGTVVGPVLGSFLLTPLDVLLRGWLGGISAGLNFIVYGLVLMVAVTYFPRGLAGWVRRWYGPLIQKLPRYGEWKPEPPVKGTPIFAVEASQSTSGSKDSTLFEVQSMSKSFGGLIAVKDVSFEIKRGEVLGLIGPNGAGKTTIFNLVTGFLSPDKGNVLFKGEMITGLKPPHRVCGRRIGRTFQLVKPFNELSVLENV